MNKFLFSLFFAWAVSFSADAQFDKYFQDKTMRFDFYHCGNQELSLIHISEPTRH